MNNIPNDIAEFLDGIAALDGLTGAKQPDQYPMDPCTSARARQLCIEHGIWKEYNKTVNLPFPADLKTQAKALVEWFETNYYGGRTQKSESVVKTAIVRALLGALTEEDLADHCQKLNESMTWHSEWRTLIRQLENSFPAVNMGTSRQSQESIVRNQARTATLAFFQESLQKAKDHTFDLALQAVHENLQAQLRAAR